ncbi:MAG TPA: AzlD domain-containing protein [Burkholderiales bacterium]|nr:AzlD domain-containing protein [Burkholderiales bacterium]
MDVRPEFLALVLGCALVTALPRVLPLVLLAKVQLPPWLADWLRYVPIAVLSALLTMELSSGGIPGVAGVTVALAVAAATRSLLGCVAAGVAVYWLLG